MQKRRPTLTREEFPPPSQETVRLVDALAAETRACITELRAVEWEKVSPPLVRRIAAMVRGADDDKGRVSDGGSRDISGA